MNLLWCNGWTAVRGDGLDAGSRGGDWAGFGTAEAVVPLVLLDEVSNVLVESLWLVRDNRNGDWFFDIRGDARWMPDGESLCVDHRESQGDGRNRWWREGRVNDGRGNEGQRSRGR